MDRESKIIIAKMWLKIGAAIAGIGLTIFMLNGFWIFMDMVRQF